LGGLNPQLKLRAIVSRAAGAGVGRFGRPRERREKVRAGQLLGDIS